MHMCRDFSCCTGDRQRECKDQQPYRVHYRGWHPAILVACSFFCSWTVHLILWVLALCFADNCKVCETADLYFCLGAFAIHAAAGGASQCIGVETSAVALELAKENAKINDFASKCTFIEADVQQYMRHLAQEKEQFDLVILDPPKFAPSRKDLQKARRKYVAWNKWALRLVKPGGLLMTC